MHYFQFEIKEWISNTAHLSLEEEAIYLRLILYYYDSEQRLPSEPLKVFRKLRITNIVDATNILNEYFVLTEKGWIHNRCDEVIDKFKSKQESASKAGKASAQARLNIRSTDVQPIINQESLIKNQIKTIEPPEGVSVDLWSDFLVYRKRMKSPITARVLARLIKEAGIAKMTLSDVLETIIFKGWKSFDATWIIQKPMQTKSNQDWRANDSLIMAKANELGLSTVGLQRYDIINKIDATLRSRAL